MADFDKALSDRNVANARRLMELFGNDMDGFEAMLHPQLRLELPYAATVGLPTEMAGDDAKAMFRTAANDFAVRFNSIEISPMADPSKVLIEYRGYGEPGGRVYDQRYVTIQQYADDKLVFYREYFNIGPIQDALLPLLAGAAAD